MRRIALLLLLAACGREEAPPAPTARERLRDDVARGLAAALPGARIEAKDDLTLVVTLEDGGAHEVRLEGLWREIEDARGADRDGRIARLVKGLTERPAPEPDADRETKLLAIVPLVRGEAYVEEMRRIAPPAARPLAADLHVVYAYDDLTVIPLDELAELGVGVAELHARAVGNLEAVIGDVRLVTLGRVRRLTCGGTFESSLLLLDDLWARLAQRVEGDVVAGCPARDLLLFADGSDPEAVAALREAVEREHGRGVRAISKRLLRRTAAGWVPFEE